MGNPNISGVSRGKDAHKKELDRPKRLKTSEDNDVIDAKCLWVGIATCLFQMRKWNLGSDRAGTCYSRSHCFMIAL